MELLEKMTILASVSVFLVMLILLVTILLYIKMKLSPGGKITIKINGEKDLVVDGGWLIKGM